MNKKKVLTIGLVIFLIAVVVVLSIFTVLAIKKAIEERELKALVEKYYAEKLEKYSVENNKYLDYEIDVAFLGDSLTDGYDVESYYNEYLVTNRGIGGDTTIGLEERLKVSVYDLKPKVIVMLIGANNMNEMFTNYEKLLIGFKQNLPDTKVVLLSLTAMGGEHWGAKNQLASYNNVKIKKYAEKYGYYFVDLFTPMFDETTGEVYEGYTVDGGHFTKLGYDVVTSLVKPIVSQALSEYGK